MFNLGKVNNKLIKYAENYNFWHFSILFFVTYSLLCSANVIFALIKAIGWTLFFTSDATLYTVFACFISSLLVALVLFLVISIFTAIYTGIIRRVTKTEETFKDIIKQLWFIFVVIDIFAMFVSIFFTVIGNPSFSVYVIKIITFICYVYGLNCLLHEKYNIEHVKSLIISGVLSLIYVLSNSLIMLS